MQSVYQQIFTDIYTNKVWGDDKNEEYSGSCGPGSSIDYNYQTLIPLLKQFIIDNKIYTISDLGCGNFMNYNINLYSDLNIKYTGYDVYKQMIIYNRSQIVRNHAENNNKYIFHLLDFFTYKEQLEISDLCIMKDVFQHWTNNDIVCFLDYLKKSKKYKFIIIINCKNQKCDDQDIDKIGDFRPLSYKMSPLNKYNPTLLGEYNSKEICLLKL